MDLIKNLQMKYPKTVQIPFYLRLLAFVLFIVFLPGPLTAQDTHFSQFYANRIFLNPAFAGLEEGLTLTAITRTQWYTVDTGFKTVGISVEKRENVSDAFAFGIGLEAYSSDEGLSRYQQQSFAIETSALTRARPCMIRVLCGRSKSCKNSKPEALIKYLTPCY